MSKQQITPEPYCNGLALSADYSHRCLMARVFPLSVYELFPLSKTGDRQALAKAANKPLLLEEFGAPRGYLKPRDVVFRR